MFACDRCHDAESDHPNEHANRMICGYCSREQNYRPEDCGICHSSLVKKAGSGFWEGGKGTRDKSRMSRKGRWPLLIGSVGAGTGVLTVGGPRSEEIQTETGRCGEEGQGGRVWCRHCVVTGVGESFRLEDGGGKADPTLDVSNQHLLHPAIILQTGRSPTRSRALSKSDVILCNAHRPLVVKFTPAAKHGMSLNRPRSSSRYVFFPRESSIYLYMIQPLEPLQRDLKISQ